MARRDFIQELGILVLDHRLKRLMNRLLEAAEQVYEARGIDFKARWVSTYRLLAEASPRSVTELAASLRLTHPAMIKLARGMIEAGWVAEQRDPADARRRLLSLTEKGRAAAGELEEVWTSLAAAQQELFEDAGINVMEVLAAVDQALDSRSLTERVLERLGAPTTTT